MKFFTQCLIIFSIWFVATVIFAIVLAIKKEEDHCSARVWYFIGSIVYFLIAVVIVLLIPRNIAKEYIKMSEDMAADSSCVSPMELCEQNAYKNFRGDPINTKKAMKTCENKSSKSHCTDTLLNKCSKLMKSKGSEYLEDFQRFAKERSIKETLGMCKGVAESNLTKN